MSRERWPAVDAVGELIRSRVEHVDTDTGRLRVTQPCLIAMLILHLHISSGGRGGGHSAGSVPLNTQAWDLLVEIRHNAYAWAELLAVDPKPYAVVDTPRAGKPTTPPIGKLLRADAITAATTARDLVADAITRCARRWKTQIEEILNEQRDQRGVRGAACPECGMTETVEQRDDVNRRRDDGQGTFWIPAVVLIAPRPGEHDHALVCVACGWQSSLGAAAELLATRLDDHQVDDQRGQAA